MKINKLLLGVFGLGLAMSSCNLDNEGEDNYITGTYPVCNMVIPAAGNAYATNATYTVVYYYVTGQLTVSTSDLNLGYNNQGFASTKMDATAEYFPQGNVMLDVTRFSGGVAANSNTNVTDIQGFQSSIFNYIGENDTDLPDYKFTPIAPLVMSYTANHDYKVKTFMKDAIYNGMTAVSPVGGATQPDLSETIRYRVIFSDDFKKADIILYDANFGNGMPEHLSFTLLLKGLDVEFNKSGYIISGADIVPMMYESKGWTPYENFPFKSFELINSSSDLTVASANYIVNVFGRDFNCNFNGAYVYTKLDDK